MARDCHLCRTIGRPNRRKIHGFHVEGMGMVDFTCPTTEDDYERDLESCAVAIAEMRKEASKTDGD